MIETNLSDERKASDVERPPREAEELKDIVATSHNSRFEGGGKGGRREGD
jgi:hypothetical protein